MMDEKMPKELFEKMMRLESKLVETLLPNGSRTTYDYDALTRITNLIHQDPTGKTDSYQYGYDPAGNKISLKKFKTDEDELEENEEKTFAYDAE